MQEIVWQWVCMCIEGQSNRYLTYLHRVLRLPECSLSNNNGNESLILLRNRYRKYKTEYGDKRSAREKEISAEVRVWLCSMLDRSVQVTFIPTFPFSYHSRAWLRDSTLQSKMALLVAGRARATDRPIFTGWSRTSVRSCGWRKRWLEASG